MKLTPKQLHKEGVNVVLRHMPETHIHLVPEKKFEYSNKDTDFLVRNRTTNSIYEMRIPTSESKLDESDKTISWLLTQHNVDSVDDNFFYGFFHIDRSTSPTSDRLFIVPSQVVSDYLKEKYDTDQKKLFEFTIDLTNTSINYHHAKDYEDNWDLLS